MLAPALMCYLAQQILNFIEHIATTFANDFIDRFKNAIIFLINEKMHAKKLVKVAIILFSLNISVSECRFAPHNEQILFLHNNLLAFAFVKACFQISKSELTSFRSFTREIYDGQLFIKLKKGFNFPAMDPWVG